MHGERWRQKPSEIGGREGVGQLVQVKNWGISHAHISNDENEFNPPVR